MYIWTPLQKLPKNVGDLGKLIVAKSFEKLPKVQKIAQSGHTAHLVPVHKNVVIASLTWSIIQNFQPLSITRRPFDTSSNKAMH